jgi:hypothetical protein
MWTGNECFNVNTQAFEFAIILTVSCSDSKGTLLKYKAETAYCIVRSV